MWGDACALRGCWPEADPVSRDVERMFCDKRRHIKELLFGSGALRESETFTLCGRVDEMVILAIMSTVLQTNAVVFFFFWTVQWLPFVPTSLKCSHFKIFSRPEVIFYLSLSPLLQVNLRRNLKVSLSRITFLQPSSSPHMGVGDQLASRKQWTLTTEGSFLLVIPTPDSWAETNGTVRSSSHMWPPGETPSCHSGPLACSLHPLSLLVSPWLEHFGFYIRISSKICCAFISRVLPLYFNYHPQVSKHFAGMFLTHLLKVHLCNGRGQFFLVRSRTWYLRTFTALLIAQSVSAMSQSSLPCTPSMELRSPSRKE